MEVTQKGTDRKQDSIKTPVKQGAGAKAPKPDKINAPTPYDFGARTITPYGGSLPLAPLLEKLEFVALVEELLTVNRIPRAMSVAKFFLTIVLGIYVGLTRLAHLQYISRDPLLTGILEVAKIPPQSTPWRFPASLHIVVSRQLLQVQRKLRERVWAAGNVKLKSIPIDTGTTVHTLYGKQMGGRKSYNTKNKGKRS
ncbi:MAG: hypothetical protein ACKV2U_04835 [Bryobacteraceae bacterium]